MLDKLLANLLALPDTELSAGVVILPTQRLCLSCQAELARNKTALFTPLIATLDNFLTHLQDNIKQPIIANPHVEYIIATELKDKSYQHLQANFAKEINLLFQEITHACIAGKGLAEQLNTAINTDNEAFLLRQQTIHTELERLYLALQKQLANDKQTTSYFAFQAQANSINLEEKLKNFAFIYVMPPLKPSKLQQILLEQIYQQPTTKIFSPHSPCQAQTKAKTLSLPSADAEVHYTLVQIKKLIKDKHCSPADIAITTADNNTYLPALLMHQANLNPHLQLHLPVPLRMTSIGMFLQMLCDYQTDKDRALLDLLHSPHTASILPKHFICAKSDKSYDKHHLAYALTQLDTPTAKDAAKDYCESIHAYLQSYQHGNCFVHLAKLIAKLEFLADECFDSKQIDRLLQFLRFIQNSYVGRLQTSMHEFWRFVADKFLQLPLQTEGEQLAGVQVISLTEACYMPFKHVYVLGCVQGRFPHKSANDFILNNRSRKHIGLSSWSDLEELAAETFKLLAANTENLNLCYPANQVPSQILSNNSLHKLTITDVYQFSPTSQKTPAAPAAAANHNCYQPQELKINKLTAYSLENFLRCPMRYLLKEAKVEPLKLPEYPSPLLEGSQLHKTIETLVSSEDYQRIKHHHPQTEREDMLTQALRQTAASIMPQDSITAINQYLFGWRRLANFLLMLEGKDIVEDIRHSKEIQIKQHRIELAGKIDHTVIDDEFVWLLEYKRKTIPTKGEVKKILSPQLLLYAYLYQQVAKTIIVYFSLLKGEWAVVAAGSEALAHAKERFGKRITIYPLEELVEQMLTNVSSRYHEIEAGGFFAKPAQAHCRNCDYMNICRDDNAAKWASSAK